MPSRTRLALPNGSTKSSPGQGRRAGRAVEQEAVLEEDHRLVAAQRRAQEADGVFRVRRHRELPADRVQELDLVALAVPGIAALEESARHAHDHRRRETVHRAPADRAAVVQLLRRGLGVLAELDLRHRHEPGERHADGAADDAFLRQAGVEDAIFAEALLQPERRGMHAALAAHVLAEHQHARVDRELVLERAADRRQHVDAGALRTSASRRRRAASRRRPTARPGPAVPGCRPRAAR